MPLVFNYQRFSSERQSQGHSLDRQKSLAEEYAERHNLTIDPRTFNDPGISAYKGKNVTEGALGVFLKAVDDGAIPSDSILLVESLDRVTRTSVMEAMELLGGIVRRGITLITVGDGMVYSKATIDENWAKLIISIAIFARGNEESKTKGTRVKAAWDDKKVKAKASGKMMTLKLPHWLDGARDLTRLDDKNKPFRVATLNKERVKVVHKILDMAERGIGNHTIIKTLHAEKIKSWSTPLKPKNAPKDWVRPAPRWEPSYIQKMLHNPALYGAIDIDGDLIEGYYPPVISYDRFVHVQSLRSARATTQNTNRKGLMVTNLFSGRLKCGYCGSSMNIAGYKSRKGPNAGYERKYVACHGARIGSTKCRMKMWFMDELEPSLLFWLTSVDARKLTGTKSEGALHVEQGTLAKLEEELSGARARVENTMKAIEEGASSMVPRLKTHEAAVTKVEKVIEIQRRKVQALEVTERGVGSQIKNLIVLFRALKQTTDEVALRALREQLSANIAATVEKIVLYPAGRKKDGDKDERFADVTFLNGAERRIEVGEC